MNMGWSGDAYEMMKHEMEGVSSTRYETNQSYHNKSKKINIRKTSKNKCEIGLKNHHQCKAWIWPIILILQRVSKEFQFNFHKED